MPPIDASVSSASDTFVALLLCFALLLRAGAAMRRRHWQRQAYRVVRRSSRLAAIGIAVAVVAALGGHLGLPLAGLAQTTPAGNDVNITDSGFQPATVTLNGSGTVHWTNTSSQAQTVTADDGLFDSGALAPGAGFSIAVASAGTHAYGSTTTPALRGSITVSGSSGGGLGGAPNDLANDHLPQMPFPAATDADVSMHPDLGIMASRTRILVSFNANATVAEANAALAAAGVNVLGGIPGLGLVLVGAPDTVDFSGIAGAQKALRASGAIDIAVGDTAVERKIVPPQAESGVSDGPQPAWSWDVDPAGSPPLGSGGNWGLEASRFPQSWNLLQAIRAKNATVTTGVVDAGFQAHADLEFTYPSLCRAKG
ncbi:MAG TPA: hypothetical protein VGQ62_18905, partial [Chloroflexota bacterium]|nr:hypothetical protein [Chloroflexota bacterium]